MTTEFDLPVIIKKLAEAEWRCPDESLQVDISDTDALASGRRQIVGYHLENCGCGGTGRIVPFASLRVECAHRCDACGLDGREYDPFDQRCYPCSCKERGWQPEPDVEKACWRVEMILRASHQGRMYLNDAVFLDIDLAESTLSAAEAWLDEKMKETP